MTQNSITTPPSIHHQPNALQAQGASRQWGKIAKQTAQAGILGLIVTGLACSLLQVAKGSGHKVIGSHRRLLDDADHGCTDDQEFHAVSDRFVQAFNWLGISTACLITVTSLGFLASHLVKKAGHEKFARALQTTSIASAYLGCLGLTGVAVMAFNLIHKNDCTSKIKWKNRAEG